jgi:uncharacterized protein YbaR (Trm112 family)
MDALRRNEIIRLWQSSEKYLDYFCCPDCRDVLEEVEDDKYLLECHNDNCKNSSYFDIKTGREL